VFLNAEAGWGAELLQLASTPSLAFPG